MEILFVFGYIHDVIVLPEYQHQKIEPKIMNKLLEKINEIKIEKPYVRIYLGT